MEKLRRSLYCVNCKPHKEIVLNENIPLPTANEVSNSRQVIHVVGFDHPLWSAIWTHYQASRQGSAGGHVIYVLLEGTNPLSMYFSNDGSIIIHDLKSNLYQERIHYFNPALLPED